jgi:sodium transport system ATP-binding protein
MIEIDGLGKSFGSVQAVSEVSFRAADRRITALLGPNGAGKSTTLRILSTVLAADNGTARVGGIDVSEDPMAVRSRIGVLPHATGLYERLTARENVRYFGELHGLKGELLRARVDELINELEMADFAERRVKGFSQGQRIKVALARALVHDPDHLLLDEPTNGLDVMATRALRELILKLRDEGRCILFSSHVMQEVANLCEDVVVIGGGQVRFQGTLDQLLQSTGEADLEDAFIASLGDSAHE